MVNVLIADDNFYYAKNLMSYINETSQKIRVCDISIDGEETLKILNTNKDIDIVLLDLRMPVYSGIEVIKRLTQEQKEKYRGSFIIISGDKMLISEQNLNDDVVYCVLDKMLSLQKISGKIINLVEEKEREKEFEKLHIRIIKELMYLGYDFSHKGTKYLIDIIYITCIRYNENIIENLSKTIYPIIAKKYGQKSNNIKSNVIRATETMYYNCEESKLKKYFMYEDIKKPKVKTVIATVIAKIKEA